MWPAMQYRKECKESGRNSVCDARWRIGWVSQAARIAWAVMARGEGIAPET
jgi:hypothetical protein